MGINKFFRRIESYFAHKGKNNISKVGLKTMFNGIKKKLNGRTFEEFDFSKISASDSFDLTKAASLMLHHVGLHGYTPIIVHERLNDKTAGYINMNSDTDFFITIDLNQSSTREQRLCILSHEICHKFMYVNNFRDTGMKNEYLTDACAVYVGFGKMMIEGCETTSVRQYENKKIINTKAIGYLEKWQLTYLYYIKNPLTFIQKLKKLLERLWDGTKEFAANHIYLSAAVGISLIVAIVTYFIDGADSALAAVLAMLLLFFLTWIRSLF